jgi:hypothetical protein
MDVVESTLALAGPNLPYMAASLGVAALLGAVVCGRSCRRQRIEVREGEGTTGAVRKEARGRAVSRVFW